MHANLPDIANRWEAKYGLGGIAELNSQLNSLPEYYLPKNQGGRIGFDTGTPKDFQKFLNERNEAVGEENLDRLMEDYKRWLKGQSPQIEEAAHGGFIPSHEAGIYGLAEGGTIAGGHQIGTPIGNRTGFGNPFGYSDAPADTSSDNRPEGMPAHLSYSAPTKTTTTTTTTGDGYQDRIIELQDRQRKQDLSDIIERGDEEKYDNPLDKYSYTPQGVINRENLKQKQALDNWNAVKDTANTWAKKKAGKAVFDHFLLGGATFGLGDVIGGLVQGFKTNKAKQEFINTIKGSIAEYQKLGIPEHSPHTDTLIQDLNQQLLDLTQTRDRPDEDPGGDPHPDEIIGSASITYDDIEDTNRKKRASMEWRRKQEEVDRSKQMAYWRMMMQPYMSAQGGRVPAGYNTGGLSNLFRLKNV